jgi:hypothetical protein
METYSAFALATVQAWGISDTDIFLGSVIVFLGSILCYLVWERGKRKSADTAEAKTTIVISASLQVCIPARFPGLYAEVRSLRRKKTGLPRTTAAPSLPPMDRDSGRGRWKRRRP